MQGTERVPFSDGRSILQLESIVGLVSAWSELNTSVANQLAPGLAVTLGNSASPTSPPSNRAPSLCNRLASGPWNSITWATSVATT